MIFIYLFAVIVIILFTVWLYMQQAKFGKAPNGARLEKMKAAPNYKNGKFQNIHITPNLSENTSIWKVSKDFIFGKYEHTIPLDALPIIPTDLKSLDKNQNVLIWMGHSSYFLQLEGVRFLMDPVLSGSASPLPRSVKAFNGADHFKAEDMPEIDYLVITHDHYDHLDFKTIKAIQANVKQVICPLGVGAHIEHWGFENSQIIEENWGASAPLTHGITIHYTPARHFSGRTFKRNNTLWTSYVIESRGKKYFIGGDSGYDTHFQDIGAAFGPFELVILENGQYNENWRNIHALPSEQLQIIRDLKAQKVMTVHHAKFKLANHTWKMPLEGISQICIDNDVSLLTPKIGEVVYLDRNQVFEKWWESVN